MKGVKIKKANIKENMIVTIKEHMVNVVKLLRSYKDYNLDFTFKVNNLSKDTSINGLFTGGNS